MDETLEQVNEQVENINEQVSEVEQNQGDNLDLPTLSPLQSEDLQQEEDAELPEPPTDTATTGLQGIIESLTAQRKEARESLTESREDVQSTMQEILDVQGQRDDLREQRGIPETQTELDELDAQLEQQQLANRRQIEEIRDAPGMTAATKQARIQEVQRKNAQQMADLAVVRSAKAQQLQTARNIVNNKIEAQLEPLRQQFKFQQSFFERNQNIFDKSEKREFQALLQQEQRNFEQTREQITELENTKFDLVQQAVANDAPASVLQSIQKAESRQEAVQAAGQFGFQQETQERNTKIVTVEGEQRLIDTQTGETIRTIGPEERQVIIGGGQIDLTTIGNAGLTMQDLRDAGITDEDIQTFNQGIQQGMTIQQILDSSNISPRAEELLLRAAGARRAPASQTNGEGNDNNGDQRTP